MSRKLLGIVVLSALAATPLASALAASKDTRALPKGDLVVTFSGSGGGTYKFHQPALGSRRAGGCRSADATYTEIDSYKWSYRFVVPPAGGTSDTPTALAGGGQLSGTEQLQQCGGEAAVTSTCTQALEPPPAANSADLAYPGVIVAASGRLVTVGAVGELIAASAQPICSGLGVLIPNRVAGFSQLQASVTFPRAQLATTGDLTRRFTMGGAGLYEGVALSGSCNSATCDVKTCAEDSGRGGPPPSCSFNESYSGTIEVRVVR
jgi:hypothetical protein